MRTREVSAIFLLALPQIWCDEAVGCGRRRPMSRKAPVVRTALARALSKSGYCSRSDARNLIAEGHVRLNGSVVFEPESPVMPGADAKYGEGRYVGADE